MMMPSTNDGADSAAQAVIVLFASISDFMSEIDKILSSKSAIHRDRILGSLDENAVMCCHRKRLPSIR
jgi:hypothetical protein